MNDGNKDSSVVKTAGRGVIFITSAKLWFMITGYVLTFGLPRLFQWSAGGDEDMGQRLYGLYGLVITGISIINNTMITGALQSVSKFTAEDDKRIGAVRRTGLLVMGGLGLTVAAIYATFSGFIAEVGFKSTDSQLAFYMRLSALVIVAYGCYAVFIGSINGRRQFGKQALFDISYATVKTAAMIGFVLLGFKVLGTVLGFVLAAGLVAIVAGFVSRVPVEGTFPKKTFISYAAVLLPYTLVFNLVLMFDLILMSGLVPRMALEAGLSAEMASQIMEATAGQYKAVQGLAFIPFQGTIAIGLVVFPLIAKVASENDAAKARMYVAKALRFTLIFIVGFAVVFAAIPKNALGLVFGDSYAVGADALRILPFGICALGLMSIGNNILNAAGMKWHALAAVIIGFLAVLGLDYFFIKAAGHGTDVLKAVALGTTIGMTIGLCVSGFFVYKRFGTFWPWLTALRVVIAAAAAMGLGYFLPDMGKLVTLVECLAVLGVYFVVLGLLREFGKEDLAQLKQVVKPG